MQRFDLHMHTTWSDGTASPEEMARAAARAGLARVGISDHSFFARDAGFCLPKDTREYVRDVRDAAERLRGIIDVRCGIEQDFYSPPLQMRDSFDYIIGSVHYLRFGDTFLTVDDTVEEFERIIGEYCEGDALRVCELYYETVAQVVERTGATIVGHFDLVAKFNERGRYFDESHPRYVAAWQRAASALLATGVQFEVNTGAMNRGWRTVAYPAPPIQQYLRENGADLQYASDAHSPEAIAFGFPL